MISRNHHTIARTVGADHEPVRGEHWQARAACAGMETEIFYPVGNARTLPPNYGPARAICATCAVRAECIEDAITHEDMWGVRGGLSPEQLTAIIKNNLCQDCHLAPAKRSSTRCHECAKERRLTLERDRSSRRRAMDGAA